MNQIATTERSTMNSVALSSGANGSSIAPQSLGDVVRFAEVMCKADIALPKHLRGNAGACMAVALQALEWQMSPFAVASKSYAVNGAIAYEAQLIAAVVNTRSGIKGRLKYHFEGEGAAMTCRVVGVLDGEECEYISPTIGSITVKNSPLWKSDPQQQLGYFSARSWARRHCPEVILGVYDREEAETFQGAGNAKDVTPAPTLAARLEAARAAPQEASQQREGFDLDYVTTQTGTPSGEAPIDQTEPEQPQSSTAPLVDENGSGSEPLQAPAADLSEKTAEPGTLTGEPSSTDLSPADLDWLKLAGKMLWAATGRGEQDVLKNQFEGIRQHHTPAEIGKAARDRGMSIYKKCKLVCFGEKTSSETLAEIALIACCEERELL